MNARILFAVTVAVALVSTFAMADEGQPLTREQVDADFNQAAANGTPARTTTTSPPARGAALTASPRRSLLDAR